MASKKPNILIILPDQHRWDSLGPYGNTEIKTPTLDAIAQDGVVFENCFCPFPVCTPSRYALLTGVFPHQNMGNMNNITLHPGLETFPRLLKQAGWRTEAIGKMHYRPTYLDVGFERMLLAEQDGPGRYDDDYHRELAARGLVDVIDLWDQVREYRVQAPEAFHAEFSTWESNLGDEDYSTTWIGRHAVEAVEQWEGGGNLLMVGFIKPHHPFDCPAPWSKLYDPEQLSLPPDWLDEPLERDLKRSPGYYPHAKLTPELMRKIKAQYYASITQIDYYVGQMVEVLKRKGLYEDTLILYTADHGEYLGFHHLILKSGYMYDPLLHVPCLVKFPGNQGAGRRSDALVNTVDLTTTILRAAGLAPGRWMRGLDLAEAGAGRELVFGTTVAGNEYSVRSRTRKLLWAKGQAPMLFDLEKDPYEVHDVAGLPEYANDVAELKEALLQWMLFEAHPLHTPFDEAPVITGPNVPEASDGHWLAQFEYFQRKMREVNR